MQMLLIAGAIAALVYFMSKKSNPPNAQSGRQGNGQVRQPEKLPGGGEKRFYSLLPRAPEGYSWAGTPGDPDSMHLVAVHPNEPETPENGSSGGHWEWSNLWTWVKDANKRQEVWKFVQGVWEVVKVIL